MDEDGRPLPPKFVSTVGVNRTHRRRRVSGRAKLGIFFLSFCILYSVIWGRYSNGRCNVTFGVTVAFHTLVAGVRFILPFRPLMRFQVVANNINKAPLN